MVINMKPVVGHEGRYSVTADGRVWSHDRITTFLRCGKPHTRTVKGGWLKPNKDLDGYPHVSLPTTLKVHRLVAQAFLPASHKPEVNHKDFDKANNDMRNLEWVTNAENLKHAAAAGRSGHRRRR